MSDERPDDLPLYTEERIGWRAWYVWKIGRTMVRLGSVTMSGIWPTDEWFYAKCPYNKEHKPPVKGCSCGIYAALNRQHLVRLGYNDYSDESRRVVGEVGLAGDVDIWTQGYKAEKARIIKLYVPFEMWQLCDLLAMAYNVPVELSNTFKGR